MLNFPYHSSLSKPVSETQHVLKELSAFRSGLLKDRTRILNRQKVQTLPTIRRHNKERLAQLDKYIIEIDAEINSLIKSSDTMARSMEILRSIPGIGAVCAATILIEMPEIGSMERKQVACLTGVVCAACHYRPQ